MDWSKLVIGGRVRVRLPSGNGDDVEVTGHLLGRDTSKFTEWGRRPDLTADSFRAAVCLDDGTIILAELDSVVGRADD